MSSQKITITVSLASTLVILGFYLVNLIPLFQQGDLNAEEIFRFAGIVIVASIVLNIAGNILANIVINIIHAIQTQSDKEVRLIEDERDKLIGLKGTQVSYVAFSLGVLIAMLTFVFGQSPLVMFSLILFFGLVASIIGDLSQFYFDQKGA
jgi:MFS family permease